MTNAALTIPVLEGKAPVVLTMAKSVEHWERHVKQNIRSGLYEPGDFILDLRPGAIQGWQYVDFLKFAAKDGLMAVGDYRTDQQINYFQTELAMKETGLEPPTPELMDAAVEKTQVWATLERDRNAVYWERGGESVMWTAGKTREQFSSQQKEGSRAHLRFGLML